VQDRLGYECAVEVSNLRPYRITVFNNKMSLKLSDKNTNGNGAAADAAADAPKLRDNTEINAKIDAYIQANAKEWDYIKNLLRERLERMLVLQKHEQVGASAARSRQRDGAVGSQS
jgi:hypothetical protein